MATYIVRIKLLNASDSDYIILKDALENENFTARNGAGSDEPQFNYYGNQSMLQVNNAVKRAAVLTGRLFSFTVLKDKAAETQQHKRPALVTFQRAGGITLSKKKNHKSKPGINE